MEAGADQKREKEEDLRRKKNLVMHKAPESQSRDSKERYNEDMSLIQQICSSIEMEPTKVKNCTRLGKTPDQEIRARPRPLRITLDSPEDAELMMKNLTKLKFAEDKIRQPRVTPDRSMKERENVRFLVQRAKNLTPEEPGKFIHIVRGNKIIRVKKSIAKNNAGNREHFELWFVNVDTLTPDEFIELQVLLQLANMLPHIIALTEAKPKNSVILWNPFWHKLDWYNLKQKNMNPNEKGRGMLFYIRKDIDYKEINDESGFEELQVYNLLLTKRSCDSFNLSEPIIYPRKQLQP